jgi:hypothetical protein
MKERPADFSAGLSVQVTVTKEGKRLSLGISRWQKPSNALLSLHVRQLGYRNLRRLGE